MINKFVVGELYFLLHYLDDSCAVPVITSLIFLGMNLEEKMGETDLWFFQDAESYLTSGGYDGKGGELPAAFKGNVAGEVFDFPEEQLHSILTVRGLIDELSDLPNKENKSGRF